jgi:hypothetical protein
LTCEIAPKSLKVVTPSLASAVRLPANREPEPSRKPRPAPEAPHVRQQALARPSIVSGGGGGGSHTMIGVGF